MFVYPNVYFYHQLDETKVYLKSLRSIVSKSMLVATSCKHGRGLNVDLGILQYIRMSHCEAVQTNSYCKYSLATFHGSTISVNSLRSISNSYSLNYF